MTVSSGAMTVSRAVGAMKLAVVAVSADAA
jgi:hypothetical protein